MIWPCWDPSGRPFPGSEPAPEAAGSHSHRFPCSAPGYSTCRRQTAARDGQIQICDVSLIDCVIKMSDPTPKRLEEYPTMNKTSVCTVFVAALQKTSFTT